MKKLLILLILILNSEFISAQIHQYVGKTLINQSLQEIYFINDSLVFFQPYAGNQKISIENDTLIIETAKPVPLNQIFINKFQIVYSDIDSIFLLKLSSGKPSKDTIKFINTKCLMESIETFNSFQYDILGKNSLAQSGSKRLYLTKDKILKVGITEGDPVLPQFDYSKYQIYKLSDKEFFSILDNLSELLIFKFGFDSGGCGFDGPTIRWILDANGKVITGKGCGINRTHSNLLKFMKNLDEIKTK